MLRLDFAGIDFAPDPARPFTIGREGDLAIDDNPYLHRRFLEIRHDGQLWWLVNVGSQLSATTSDRDGGVHAWLSPGGRLPVVFHEMCVRFTAGSTAYEINVVLADAPYSVDDRPIDVGSATATVGRVALTRDQRLLIVALAEPALRQRPSGSVVLPSNTEAAMRLGWPITKFNRKLDNVCQKFSRHGIRGLHGDAGNLASGRRARLVEHALATRLISVDDLDLLDLVTAPS